MVCLVSALKPNLDDVKEVEVKSNFGRSDVRNINHVGCYQKA